MVVTPLYAGLLTLWFLILSFHVTMKRQQNTIPIGDQGNQNLLRVIRAQANFAEYVPLALLMMFLLETSHFSIYFLHLAGIILVLSRLLHGYALSFTHNFKFGRVIGAALTWGVLLVEALLCLHQSWRGHF